MKNYRQTNFRVSMAAASLFIGVSATAHASPVYVDGINPEAAGHSTHHQWMQEFSEVDSYIHGKPPTKRDVPGFFHMEDDYMEHGGHGPDHSDENNSAGEHNYFVPFGSEDPPGLERGERKWKLRELFEDHYVLGMHFREGHDHSSYGRSIKEYVREHRGVHFNAETATVVPVPAAVWLFGSGLIALTGFSRRTKEKFVS